MKYWIFQGNPDVFDIESYVSGNDKITWSLRQANLATDVMPGDTVLLWRAKGSGHKPAGIIAIAEILDYPTVRPDNPISLSLWRAQSEPVEQLRVSLAVVRRCVGAKEIVQRSWLLKDPVASSLKILKMAAETNYLISDKIGRRLEELARNTGRNWNRAESLAGLWAYRETIGGAVSRLPGSPVSDVALRIGRSLDGVYNKVMNFRHIDPTDERKGLSAAGEIDRKVWSEFYDVTDLRLRAAKLTDEFDRLWPGDPGPKSLRTYAAFGEAPNDDPNELQLFAAKVRRGQPQFRQNLIAEYDGRCAISGHGPSTVLEAVHIVPHAKSGINEIDNGLLLRADLHALLDASLIWIDPDTLRVMVDSQLNGTPYEEFHGRVLRDRSGAKLLDAKYIRQRWGEGHRKSI